MNQEPTTSKAYKAKLVKKKLEAYMELTGKSPYDLVGLTKTGTNLINPRTIYNFLRGSHSPYPKTLTKISQWLKSQPNYELVQSKVFQEPE